MPTIFRIIISIYRSELELNSASLHLYFPCTLRAQRCLPQEQPGHHLSKSKCSWVSLTVQLQTEIITQYIGLSYICESSCEVLAQQEGRQVGKGVDLNKSEMHPLSPTPTGPAAPKQLSYRPNAPKLMGYICCANCSKCPSGTANLLKI